MQIGNEGYILAFVKPECKFLLIVSGTGDNLDNEDIANGMVDYVMYTTFKIGDVRDAELPLEEDDGGQYMADHDILPGEALKECYYMAFDKTYDEEDVLVLVNAL